MENALLILCLVTASLGFIVWYVLSSSLRLPVRYQIMYDANPPYVNRILRRRTLATIIYALIPLFIIRYTNWIERPSLSDLNISFAWNAEVTRYSAIGILVVVIMSWFSTKTQSSLELYPEVRVRFWRPNILLWSGLSWVMYILAYEFFYRGLLFQALLFKMDLIPAIAACTALYSLTHYFKLNRLTTLSILWSISSCYIVWHTGSLWPAILIHLSLCLSIEWLSIKHHREMYVRRT
jgi:membrane protease YdiL (CAAX protease family)